MLAFCYHNGALGHTVTALMDCCTKEGNAEFPSFVKGNNLHHHYPLSRFYQVKHPDIDMVKERAAGNTIISSSSFSTFGRLLIILMGLKKWKKAIPEFNKPVILRQDGVTIQEQIEVLSNTLLDKVHQSEGWFADADHVLDITSFWNSPAAVSLFLKECGLHPVDEKVEDFCHIVAESNQEYFNTIEKCVKISTDVTDGKEYAVDLDFFETAMCHMLVMQKTNKRFYEQPRRLKFFPTNTVDYIKLFKD
jgi:hypothetical protein